MKTFLLKYWSRIIRIGYVPQMELREEARLLTVNALMIISIAITLIFVAINALMGAYSVFRSLYIIPVLGAVLFFNYKKKYELAGYLLSYGLLILVLSLSIAERRTGTEYVLIAIGCCSVTIFERLSAIVAAFMAAFSCYVFYSWYDSTHIFHPNPTIPYAFAQNSIMFISGLVVVAQSVVFRFLIHRYALVLKGANAEIATVNEELRASNEELHAFSENLDLMVRQKSAELQAYIDGINVSIYSTVSDLEGNFLVVNKQVLSTSGYSADELVGKHYSILGSGNHSEAFFESRRKTLMNGEVWRGEVEHKTKNGLLLWFDCVVIPIKDADQRIRKFITLGLPVTERKLRDQLQEDTLRLLESIAFRASHNIRGPLARIKGLSDLVRKDMIDAQEFTLIAEKMTHCTEELSIATSELVDYVNNHQEQMEDFDRGAPPS